MCKRWWVLLPTVVLTLLVYGIDSQAPVFLVHPVSINTTEGSVVEFICVANNTSTSLGFLVDGEVVDPNKGFDEQHIMGTDTLSRTLVVTASVVDNDNSMIRCQALNADLMGTDSDIAILRVQGPLSSIVDLSYSFISCYSINISWSPPITLPGTDITGYNTSTTSNGTTTNYFTSNSYYELSLTDPFNENMVNISGYNGLDGEVTPLDTIIPPARNISLSLDVIIDHTFFIFLNFTAEATGNICPYEYPTSFNYSVLFGDHLISNNTSYADVVDIDYTLNTTRGQMYTIMVSFTNELLPNLYQYNRINTIFDTYDLVSVHVLNSSNDTHVCLECSFSSFSTDNARCTVEIVSSANTYTQTFSKPNASDIVQGCIDGISPGQYNITVHGNPPVLELNVTGALIEDITTSTSTTTNTTTTTTTSITVDDTSPTSSVDTKATNLSGRSSKTVTIIIIVIVIVIVVALAIAIIVGIVLVYKKKSWENKKLHPPVSTGENQTPKDETPPPPIDEATPTN